MTLTNDAMVQASLRKWAEDLVDLTRNNRLLYFRHTQTSSFQFAQPATEIERGLSRRQGWGFHLPPPPPEDGEQAHEAGFAAADALVVDMQPTRYGPKIARGLTTLRRTAEAEFLDAGIWVLYLGLGMLDWKDPIDGKPAQSPLLLVPVSLSTVGADQRWTLQASDDGEPALNPALSLKLAKDFGITLPALDDLEEVSVTNVIAAVRKAIGDTDWVVRDTAVLRTFTFYKEVIYRDLTDNVAEIVEHPLVELLALGPSSDAAAALDFEPDAEASLDEQHPPEDLACVLDADATQRQCLIAARSGRSFVMDGPPGTGKSQTIANLIAQLLADDKTVLFVSEKAAALEVVHNRLAALKLDPFVLALHSHRATRKAVAQELGVALTDRPTATSRFDATQRAQLQRDRRQLTAYALAMNEIRHPLERDLHSVIGRITELDRLSQTPVPSVQTIAMTADDLAALRGSASALGRAWGPIARRDDFLWRDLRSSTGGATRQADSRRLVQTLAERLDVLSDEVAAICDELYLPPIAGPAAVGEVQALLDLLDGRSPVGPDWLSSQDPDATDRRLTALLTSLEEIDAAQTWLEATSPSWQAIDPTTAQEIAEVESELIRLRPPLDTLGPRRIADLPTLHDALEASATALQGLAPASAVLTEAFAAPSDPPLHFLARLADLAQLAGSQSPPEPSWLNPMVRNALEEARAVLADLLQTYRSRRDALQATFTDAALDLDLRSIHTRITTVHTGLGKFSSASRADRRAIASVAVSGKAGKDVLAKLEEAVEWKELAERLTQAEARHGPALGSRYYPSRDGADLDEIERALAVADQALAVAAGDVDPDSLAKQLGLGGSPDPRLPQAGATVKRALDDLHSGAVAALLGDNASDLEALTLREAASWCADAAAAVGRVRLAHESPAEGLGPDVTIEVSTTLAGRRAVFEQATTAHRQQALDCSAELGPLAEDLTTPRLREAQRWVTTVRAQLGGPLRGSTASALLTTELDPASLKSTVASYVNARDELLAQFQEAHASELVSEINTSFDAGKDLLLHLTSSLADIDEWCEFVRTRAELAERGWEPVVVSLEEQAASARDVADVIERAALTRWVDEVIDHDERLRPRRSVDRDQLLDEFRVLDEALVSNAAADVINTCTERRPRSLVGGGGVIKQQAGLTRRHKPVRKLLEEAGSAVQAIKPCFMMSPLSVSQFLPAKLHFDVVIFDEASQVREADAIGCIYRGEQLIVAGDPKQLPPTNFFSSAADLDGDEAADDFEVLDYESVLNRCKAQGFPELPLNWHYRSRHEALITFSNHSFYDGRLHTFPGATFESPDLGVEFFHVDGEYRRGGTRDNPIEADKVVDRIVHHRRHHPDLTLGVIALSVAQQVAIETAIERRGDAEPELRELITDDRLDGFFVKNLENVQGDERDLIILSIGYGPDENGKLTMNFGPMNREGGERRLNVAVTRARRRVEVVSSVTAAQISSPSPPIRHLARYLDYAERGTAALAIDLEESHGDAESPFEEEVLRSIRALGYDPVPQVGVAGFRVDIGVKHPTLPGHYVLGVECDGATYHSSKVARDRDRLRQDVLEGLGWTIHRIWSTAWFSDRVAEEARLRRAIESSIAGRSTSPAAPPTTAPVEVVVHEYDFDDLPDWVDVYRPPVLEDVHEDPASFVAPRSRPSIARQVEDVVRQSGPIHTDAVLDVIRRSWNIGRAGAKIQEAFKGALRSALSSGNVVADDEFLRLLDAPVVVRAPEDELVAPRRISQVAPAELDLAITLLLRDAGESPLVNIRTAWARLFGWRRVGSEIEVAFEDAIIRLHRAGSIAGSDSVRLTAE